MRLTRRLALLAAATSLVAAACRSGDAGRSSGPLVVLAPEEARTTMTALGGAWQTGRPGGAAQVRMSFVPSVGLAAAVTSEIDVVIADPPPLDELDRKGALVPGTRRPVAGGAKRLDAAVTRTSAKPDAGTAFVAFCRSDDAAAFLVANGYAPAR